MSQMDVEKALNFVGDTELTRMMDLVHVMAKAIIPYENKFIENFKNNKLDEYENEIEELDEDDNLNFPLETKEIEYEMWKNDVPYFFYPCFNYFADFKKYNLDHYAIFLKGKELYATKVYASLFPNYERELEFFIDVFIVHLEGVRKLAKEYEIPLKIEETENE